jgi:hypothetical protein
MKKIIYTSIGFFLLQAFLPKASAQANVQLSNLDNPTKINVHLLPDKDNMRSLGNLNKEWKDIYMRGIIWKEGYTFLGGIYYSGNTFVGQSAGYNLITTGESTNQNNTFIGSNAGFDNTTGGYNTFLGTSAGQNNTTGGGNTFVGQGAGEDNATGANNTFLGIQAGTRNTTGRDNVMIGEVAGGFNKTGRNNVYVGNLSGYLGSAGSYNTFVGDSAGLAVTSSDNTMIGSKSGASSTSAFGNTFLGTQSAVNNTTGSYNTAIGYFALDDNSTSTGNTALGYSSGTLFTNGSYNTFIGYDADATAASFTNSTALGNGSRVTASNQVRIGNSSISSIGGYEDWSNISDGRFKKNINENVPGLRFINKLKPVTYNLDVSGIENKLSSKKENVSEVKDAVSQEAIQAKEKVLQTGFVAQDVESVAKEIGYDFSGVDAPKNSNDFYGLRYASFVVPLVKAVQELSKMNDEKDALIAQQQQQITNILKRLQALERQNGISENTNISAAESTSLNQNVPNPFNTSTVISYSMPKTSRSAKMNIIDEKGKTVKTITLGNTPGKIAVNSNELTNGNYFYELIVDGKKSGSRQMTIIK